MIHVFKLFILALFLLCAPAWGAITIGTPAVLDAADADCVGAVTTVCDLGNYIVPSGIDAILVLLASRSSALPTIQLAGTDATHIIGESGGGSNIVRGHIFLAATLASIGTGSKAATCTLPEADTANHACIVSFYPLTGALQEVPTIDTGVAAQASATTVSLDLIPPAGSAIFWGTIHSGDPGAWTNPQPDLVDRLDRGRSNGPPERMQDLPERRCFLFLIRDRHERS